MTREEEALMLHMFEKNESLKEEKALLEEKNALLKDETTELRSKRDHLFRAVQGYDFILHEFESMLRSAGATSGVINKLKDRGLANVRS